MAAAKKVTQSRVDEAKGDAKDDVKDSRGEHIPTGQPDPARVAQRLDNPASQRDPKLYRAPQFIEGQDYEAKTTICPVCQAEFNPGTPVL